MILEKRADSAVMWASNCSFDDVRARQHVKNAVRRRLAVEPHLARIGRANFDAPELPRELLQRGLRVVAETEPDSRATLLYGNRRTSSIMFLEELEDLKNRFPARFHLINVLSREAQDADLEASRRGGDACFRILKRQAITGAACVL